MPTRREFVKGSIASLSTLPADIDREVNDDSTIQAVQELRGPRSALPDPDSEFFNDTDRARVFFAYRYIDEVTAASWIITQDLDVWHPEPVGIADTDDLNNHAVSLVTHNEDLYVRRYV